MQKAKFNVSNMLSIIKCCLLGILFTLLGTVLFAVVLKFVDLSSSAMGYINNTIKGLSIFFMILCVKKANSEHLFFKSIIAGLVYSLLSHIIFSILNGGIEFGLSFMFDMIFAVIVSMVSSVIVNLFKKKI